MPKSSLAGTTHRTDASGMTTVTTPPGTVDITVAQPASLSARPPSITLRRVPSKRWWWTCSRSRRLKKKVTVVATTRTDKRLEDQPMRVEVLAREEIEEKMLMTPGDIVMMLNEMGGMRVQATSPSLGAASVRIQGMRGRYTRVLSDGLPLFGEVGGARPAADPADGSRPGRGHQGRRVGALWRGRDGRRRQPRSRGGRPVSRARGFCSTDRRAAPPTRSVSVGAPAHGWSASLLGGGHWQQTTDVDDDAWADLPGYERAVVRPRLFWDDGNGRNVLRDDRLHLSRTATAARSTETCCRRPGSRTSKHSRRIAYDVGAVGQFLLERAYRRDGRAARSPPAPRHRFGEVRRARSPRHRLSAKSRSAERRAAARGSAGRGIERDVYRRATCRGSTTPSPCRASFVQDDVDVKPGFSLSSSGRLDVHSEYGTFFSPRVSALVRAGRWTSRAVGGTGFLRADAVTEETEAAGLTRLTFQPPLEAERGLSASFDLVAHRRTAVLHGDAVRVARRRPDRTWSDRRRTCSAT